MRSRASLLGLFRNQDQAEIRSGLAGGLEQAADRTHAGGDPLRGRQARAAHDGLGLLPHWAKDEKLSYSTFNARAEEFTTKPAFKDAWKWGQRCLVVTDGFYEWKKLDAKGKQKQPYAIAITDDAPMVMAGLWAKWKDPKSGAAVQSCTILTCGPNALMAELHDRMPVILAEKDWPQWLGEVPASEEELLALLKRAAHPHGALVTHDPINGLQHFENADANVRRVGP